MTTQATMAAPPERGEQIRDFTGVTPDGRTVRSRDFYMRRNLALVFTHGPECLECRNRLRELGALDEAVRAEVGQTLAVVFGAAEDWTALASDLPYPLVVDPDGAIHRSYGLLDEAGAPRAAIFAVDRFGTVFEPSVADAEHEMMAGSKVPGWLEFIACRCS